MSIRTRKFLTNRLLGRKQFVSCPAAAFPLPPARPILLTTSASQVLDVLPATPEAPEAAHPPGQRTTPVGFTAQVADEVGHVAGRIANAGGYLLNNLRV